MSTAEPSALPQPGSTPPRLAAESACRELVLRAAALADAGQAEALAALFTPDARLTRPNGVALQGRHAIAHAYRERPPHRITVHLVCGTLFDAIDEREARATSRVLLWSGDTRSEPGPQGRSAEARQIVGRFTDRFALVAEGWRIAERVASFDLHSPDAARAMPAPGPGPVAVAMQAHRPATKPYADIPGTTVFDADMSRRGYWLNQFCMSLMQPDNRARFKADEDAYLAQWPLTPLQRAAVRARDYNACIAQGGNIYFLVKIGATDGISVQQLVGSMSGMDEQAYRGMMLAGGRSPQGNRRLGETGDAQPPQAAC